MSKRIPAAMIGVALAIGMVSRQGFADGMVLRYQWNAGEESTLSMTCEGNGEMVLWMEIGGKGGEQDMDLTTVTKLPVYQTVESVDADGNAATAYQIGEMVVDVSGEGFPPQHIVVDPTGATMKVGEQETPMPEAAQWFFGRPIRMVMSPAGEVLEFYAPISHHEMFDMAGFSPAQFAQLVRTAQIALPKEGIQEGHSWAQTVDLSFYAPDEKTGAEEGVEAMPMLMTTVYTLAGFEQVDGSNCAKVDMVGVMELKEPTTVPISMPGVELTLEMGPARISISGFSYFDYENGRVVKSEIDTIMNMKQAIEGQFSFLGQTQNIQTEVAYDNYKTHTVMVRED